MIKIESTVYPTGYVPMKLDKFSGISPEFKHNYPDWYVKTPTDTDIQSFWGQNFRYDLLKKLIDYKKLNP